MSERRRSEYEDDARPLVALAVVCLAVALAVVCLAVAPAVQFCGCAALERATPPILSGIERVIAAELDAATDEQRRRDLEEARRILEECRAAQAAAEEAARRAAEAAALARDEAERTERAREDEARLRAREDLARLRAKLVRLGVAKAAP